MVVVRAWISIVSTKLMDGYTAGGIGLILGINDFFLFFW